MGALFNDINRRVTMMRKRRLAHSPFKRLIELLVITGVFATVCFVLPVLWSTCTPLPTGTYINPCPPSPSTLSLTLTLPSLSLSFSRLRPCSFPHLSSPSLSLPFSSSSPFPLPFPSPALAHRHSLMDTTRVHLTRLVTSPNPNFNPIAPLS